MWAQIPEKPAQAIEDLRGQANVSHLHQLVSLFETRPAWTRVALLNQFDAATAREIVNSKALLPLVCYVFQDGPWRDTLIRFGWDPRKDVSGRLYVHYFHAVSCLIRCQLSARLPEKRESPNVPSFCGYKAATRG